MVSKPRAKATWLSVLLEFDFSAFYIFFSLFIDVFLDNFVIYFSDSTYEVSDCPKNIFFPEVVSEIFLILRPNDLGGPSFKYLYNIGNWISKWYADIHVDMVFFESDGKNFNIHFFTDSFDDLLYLSLKYFGKYFSSIFSNPYYVVPTVVGDMGSFSIFHIDFLL